MKDWILQYADRSSSEESAEEELTVPEQFDPVRYVVKVFLFFSPQPYFSAD